MEEFPQNSAERARDLSIAALPAGSVALKQFYADERDRREDEYYDRQAEESNRRDLIRDHAEDAHARHKANALASDASRNSRFWA